MQDNHFFENCQFGWGKWARRSRFISSDGSEKIETPCARVKSCGFCERRLPFVERIATSEAKGRKSLTGAILLLGPHAIAVALAAILTWGSFAATLILLPVTPG